MAVTTSGSAASADLTVALVSTATRMWWRRLVGRVGDLAAGAFCVFALAATVGFWVWIWPQVRSPLDEVISVRPDFEKALVISVMVGFALIVALVRVLMLAFDTLSQDLRILLATAPLSRASRAVVSVVPDLGASWMSSMFFGSVGIFACAAVAPHFSFGEAVAWGTATVVLIGALAAVIEGVCTIVGRDTSAARAMAAIGMLGALSGLLIWVGAALQSDPTNGPIAQLGGRLLGLETTVSVLIALGVTVGGMGIWFLAAGWTTRALFRSRSARPWIRVRGGSAFGSSAVAFLRDAGNRFGMISLAALIALGFSLETSSGLPVASQVTLAALVLVVTGSAVMSYGDYVTLRWRVLASPVEPRRIVAAWIAGHVLTAVVLAAALVAVVRLVRPEAVALSSTGEWATLGTIALIGLGSGCVAGRVLPYEKEDVFSIAGTGFVDILLGVSAYYLVNTLAPAVGVPSLLAAALYAIAAIAAVLLAERRTATPGLVSSAAEEPAEVAA